MNYLKKNKNLKMWLSYGLLLIVGVYIGRLTVTPTIIKSQILRESGYNYINPILLCNTNNNQKYNEDNVLSNSLLAYTKSKPENDISAYFLSLGGMGWAGVNLDDTFSPASMLKVPTVVEALKYQETHPDTLSREVYYDGSFDDNALEYFPPKKALLPGKSYTIDQLIGSTITYSDNNALRLIHDGISAYSFSKLYSDLGITIPANTVDFMSAKTYSLFLRVLYNSTYLTRESSEKLLTLMTTSDFPNGLKAGVPRGIAVADKFGERQIFNTDETLQNRELHDCGIIYAGTKPYILCVMTRGLDFASLASSIQDISKIVYDNVTKN